VTREILEDAESRMAKSLAVITADFAKIRTGRAHPDILAHIIVDYYGVPTPVSQMANVNVLDSRTLGVTPWEKNMVSVIEKAIMISDLGLNPVNLGDTMKIPLPHLNEERRRELVKVVKSEAEKGKVMIRNIRRDANSDFKDLLKEKEITEDNLKRAEGDIQKITDKFVSDIDKLAQEKERVLMEL